MASRTIANKGRTGSLAQLTWQKWTWIGLLTGGAAVILVLLVQALALAVWPEAASFKPLDSYPRTVIFTLVPVVIATAVFARLARTSQDPIGSFTKIAVIVLLLSFIPDYLLPDANKTFLASSIAAFMHVVAALVTTLGLIAGYKKVTGK